MYECGGYQNARSFLEDEMQHLNGKDTYWGYGHHSRDPKRTWLRVKVGVGGLTQTAYVITNGVLEIPMIKNRAGEKWGEV